MAKQKYYYAIVRKDNGSFPTISALLPIYWLKKVAKYDAFRLFGMSWNSTYVIQKISVSDLEAIILKSKKA